MKWIPGYSELLRRPSGQLARDAKYLRNLNALWRQRKGQVKCLLLFYLFVREKENTGGIAGGTNPLTVSRPNMFVFLRRKSSVYEFIVYLFALRTDCMFPIRLYSGGNLAFAPVYLMECIFCH
ncbi:MAG: hypothetical protein LBQ83_07960 [Candidatus Margulisbacteria bacterium]|nr:hypothetical protein [Candidatus Margulisiibacteriota bacterium]